MQQFETLTQEQVNRRAGGRRHYNSIRAFRRSMRRSEIVLWWQDNGGLTDWGTQRRLAAKWDVSPATICRDVAAILQTGLFCEKCGQHRPQLWGNNNPTVEPDDLPQRAKPAL